MSEQTKQEEPTKLIWFWSSVDRSDDIREHLSSLTDLVRHLGYNFEFQMPGVVCYQRKEEQKTEKYINWRGKERERILPGDPTFLSCQHCLVFNKVLSDAELTFWRTIKLGYLARDFHPQAHGDETYNL